MLAQRGAAVVDADAISRDLTGPRGKALPAIIAMFGKEFIGPHGALDRDRMRSLVYADAGARLRLESIVHPLVALETQEQALRAANAGRACVVFDIPLLVESTRWRQEVDHVLIVDCTTEIQIDRAMARSELKREAVEKIIASQASRERRLSAADTVIFNTGLLLEQLDAELGEIAPRFGLSSH